MRASHKTIEYEHCFGCNGLVPSIDGPTHPYIGAPAGCWAVSGEVLAREYGDYRYAPVHQLTVDTYAIRHPGTPSRKSKRSVAVHLISLYLMIEKGQKPGQARRALKKAARSSREFAWLDPPDVCWKGPARDERYVLE